MRLWRSPIGAFFVVLLLAATAGVVVVGVRVAAETKPRRAAGPAIDFEAMRIGVEDVAFPATDDLQIRGWLLSGRPDRPPLVLCHDLGADRAALLNLAIVLRKQGFPVLLFDFRGHGASEGERSTLGLEEKRDVAGAIDFLAARREQGTDSDGGKMRVGVYGVGMGAYAAVLAAADRPSIRALVLDGLYPDVGYRIAREVYGDWRFAERNLAFVPRTMFAAMNGMDGQRAADVVGRLPGRDILFLAPAGDAGLADAMQRMFESVPQQADVDGNLVVLPATHADGLYEANLSRYHERVSSFFTSRLGVE